MIIDIPIFLGDVEGHAFHGNQWTGNAKLAPDTGGGDGGMTEVEEGHDQTMRGEFWLQGSTAMSADGDIDDMNHEAYAIQQARSDLADSLGVDSDDDDADTIIEKYAEDHPDEADILRGSDYSTPEAKKLFEEIGLSPDTLSVAQGFGDSRLWAAAEHGWVRVAGNSVQTVGIDSSKMSEIADGLHDAYGEDVETQSFDVEVVTHDSARPGMVVNSHTYRDVPFQVLGEGNMRRFSEYRDAAFSLSGDTPKPTGDKNNRGESGYWITTHGGHHVFILEGGSGIDEDKLKAAAATLPSTPGFGTAQSRAASRAAGNVISGNTYRVKDLISHYGGQWDGKTKDWVMPNAESTKMMRDVMAGKYNASTASPAPRVSSPAAAPLVIHGATFGIKDVIKSAGGRWNPNGKNWLMPNQEAVEKVRDHVTKNSIKGVNMPDAAKEPAPAAKPEADAVEARQAVRVARANRDGKGTLSRDAENATDHSSRLDNVAMQKKTPESLTAALAATADAATKRRAAADAMIDHNNQIYRDHINWAETHEQRKASLEQELHHPEVAQAAAAEAALIAKPVAWKSHRAGGDVTARSETQQGFTVQSQRGEYSASPDEGYVGQLRGYRVYFKGSDGSQESLGTVSDMIGASGMVNKHLSKNKDHTLSLEVPIDIGRDASFFAPGVPVSYNGLVQHVRDPQVQKNADRIISGTTNKPLIQRRIESDSDLAHIFGGKIDLPTAQHAADITCDELNLLRLTVKFMVGDSGLTNDGFQRVGHYKNDTAQLWGAGQTIPVLLHEIVHHVMTHSPDCEPEDRHSPLFNSTYYRVVNAYLQAIGSTVCLSLDVPIELGDVAGHEFRGNQYTVGIAKDYFPKEMHPKGIGESFVHTTTVKAGSRAEAASKYWAEHGPSHLPRMIPEGRLPRKVSVHVSSSGFKPGMGSETGSGPSRLMPILVHGPGAPQPLERTFKTMKHAANELQAIRNDFASAAHDPIDQLKARVDAVGKWAAGQKNTKFIAKLLEEAHMLHDRLSGGSGKAGMRIQMNLDDSLELGDTVGHEFRGNQWTKHLLAKLPTTDDKSQSGFIRPDAQLVDVGHSDAFDDVKTHAAAALGEDGVYEDEPRAMNALAKAMHVGFIRHTGNGSFEIHKEPTDSQYQTIQDMAEDAVQRGYRARVQMYGAKNIPSGAADNAYVSANSDAEVRGISDRVRMYYQTGKQPYVSPLRLGDVAGHEFHGNQWTNHGLSKLPTTENQDDAGFIRPDAKLIDMGRSIGFKFDKNGRELKGGPLTHLKAAGSHSQLDVAFAHGFIRYYPEHQSFDIHKEPNDAQYERIAAMVHKHAAEDKVSNLELFDSKGESTYIEIEPETPDLAVSKIRSFYSGVKPYASPLRLGDVAGHEFHGNQWTEGAARLEVAAIKASKAREALDALITAKASPEAKEPLAAAWRKAQDEYADIHREVSNMPPQPPPPLGSLTGPDDGSRFDELRKNGLLVKNGRPTGTRDVGPVDIKGWRVGSRDDKYGRGVFYASDDQGAKAYASLHPGEEVKADDLHLTNVLLAGHQDDVSMKLFGKHYGDMMDGLAARNKSEVVGGQKFDVKLAKEAKKRGYDAIIYTAPAPPASGEIAVLGSKKRAAKLSLDVPLELALVTFDDIKDGGRNRVQRDLAQAAADTDTEASEAAKKAGTLLMSVRVEGIDQPVEFGYGQGMLHDVDCTSTQNDVALDVALSGVDAVNGNNHRVDASVSMTPSGSNLTGVNHGQPCVEACAVLTVPKVTDVIEVDIALPMRLATSQANVVHDGTKGEIERFELPGFVSSLSSLSASVTDTLKTRSASLQQNFIKTSHGKVVATPLAAFLTSTDGLGGAVSGTNRALVEQRRVVNEPTNIGGKLIREKHNLLVASTRSTDRKMNSVVDANGRRQGSNHCTPPSIVAGCDPASRGSLDLPIEIEQRSGIDGKSRVDSSNSSSYDDHTKTSLVGCGHAPGVSSTQGQLLCSSINTDADQDVRHQLAKAALETDLHSSPAQQQSGSYKKGRVTIAGLGIAIENPHMSTRCGIGANGPWSTVMKGGHYGYIYKIDGNWAPRSEADGDHMDIFVAPDIGNGPETDTVYVIDQTKVGSPGEFDEAKAMFGYPNADAAVKAYFDSYSPGWANVADMVQIPLGQFKAWVESGKTAEPAGLLKNGTAVTLSHDEDEEDDDDDTIVEPNVLGGHNYRKQDGRTASTRRNVFGGESQVGDGDFETRPGVGGTKHVSGHLKFSTDVPLELGDVEGHAFHGNQWTQSPLAKLPTTTDTKSAGFIRPDGKLVDLNRNKREGYLSHSNAAEGNLHQELARNGFIRWSPDGYKLDIRSEPTDEQYAAISDIIAKHHKPVDLEMGDQTGKADVGSWENGVAAVKKLKDWSSNGALSTAIAASLESIYAARDELALSDVSFKTFSPTQEKLPMGNYDYEYNHPLCKKHNYRHSRRGMGCPYCRDDGSQPWCSACGEGIPLGEVKQDEPHTHDVHKTCAGKHLTALEKLRPLMDYETQWEKAKMPETKPQQGGMLAMFSRDDRQAIRLSRRKKKKELVKFTEETAPLQARALLHSLAMRLIACRDAGWNRQQIYTELGRYYNSQVADIWDAAENQEVKRMVVQGEIAASLEKTVKCLDCDQDCDENGKCPKCGGAVNVFTGNAFGLSADVITAFRDLFDAYLKGDVVLGDLPGHTFHGNQYGGLPVYDKQPWGDAWQKRMARSGLDPTKVKTVLVKSSSGGRPHYSKMLAHPTEPRKAWVGEAGNVHEEVVPHHNVYHANSQGNVVLLGPKPDHELKFVEDGNVTASLDIPLELHMATGKRDETIGIDFDGTLVKRLDGPYNPAAHGDPIDERWDEVRAALDAGKQVVIFTARVANDPNSIARGAIEDLCMEELGQVLPITNEKTPNMIRIIDDRATGVTPDGTDMPSLAASLDIPLVLGDTPGHEFHGNQWTGGGGAAQGAANAVASGDAAMLVRMGQPHPAFTNFKQPMRKLLRWCGREGMNLQQAKNALNRAGLKVPPDPTIRAELPIGARGLTRGGRGADMPNLTDEQKAILRGRIGGTDPGVAGRQAAAAAEWQKQQAAKPAPAAKAPAAAPAAPPAQKYADHKDRADRADAAERVVRDRIIRGERGAGVYRDRAVACLAAAKIHDDAAAAARAEGKNTEESQHGHRADEHEVKAAKYNDKLDAANKVTDQHPDVKNAVKSIDDAMAATRNQPAQPAQVSITPADKVKREGELASTPAKKIGDIPGVDKWNHVSQTFLITDQDGKKHVFKPVNGEADYSGVWYESSGSGPGARREAAAYSMAKCVGMTDIVPVTVMRNQPKIKSEGGETVSGTGSAQDFCDGCKTARKSANAWDGEKDAARCAAFDYVMGLTDRHQNNWLIDKDGADDGKIHLIDHGYSLPDVDKSLDDRGFLGHASQNRTPISDEIKSAWRGKWGDIEVALKKLDIGPKAIEKCKARYDNLLRAKNFREISLRA